MARQQNETMAKEVTQLGRDTEIPPNMRNGVQLFQPKNGTQADIRIVNELRDE